MIFFENRSSYGLFMSRMEMSIKVETEESLVLREIDDCKPSAKS